MLMMLGTISPFELMILGFVITVSMMFLVWLVSEKIHNAGIVDVFWGLGFAIVTGAYFLFYSASPSSWQPRNMAVLVMVSIWSLRLAFFLWQRFKRHYPEEDGRYAAFRKAWGKNHSICMLGAFQLQAVLLASLTMPFAVSMAYGSVGFKPCEIAGMLLWLVSVTGESLADHQLDSFKKDAANKGQVCQVGLWNYSRHPNYFFEWLIWVAFCLFSMTTTDGLYTLYCPVVMYYFLTQVTGVKATEEQSLRTKGDAYAQYQKSTSAFFPWFKKHAW